MVTKTSENDFNPHAKFISVKLIFSSDFLHYSHSKNSVMLLICFSFISFSYRSLQTNKRRKCWPSNVREDGLERGRGIGSRRRRSP